MTTLIGLEGNAKQIATANELRDPARIDEWERVIRADLEAGATGFANASARARCTTRLGELPTVFRKLRAVTAASWWVAHRRELRPGSPDSWTALQDLLWKQFGGNREMGELPVPTVWRDGRITARVAKSADHASARPRIPVALEKATKTQIGTCFGPAGDAAVIHEKSVSIIDGSGARAIVEVPSTGWRIEDWAYAPEGGYVVVLNGAGLHRIGVPAGERTTFDIPVALSTSKFVLLSNHRLLLPTREMLVVYRIENERLVEEATLVDDGLEIAISPRATDDGQWIVIVTWRDENAPRSILARWRDGALELVDRVETLLHEPRLTADGRLLVQAAGKVFELQIDGKRADPSREPAKKKAR